MNSLSRSQFQRGRFIKVPLQSSSEDDSVNSIFNRYKSLIRHNAAYLKTQRPFLIDKDLVVTDL